MVIEVDLSLRGDEDLEFVGVRNVGGHAVVQSMDALDDDGLVFADVESPSGDPFALLKIELRQGDGLAGDEVDHVLVE